MRVADQPPATEGARANAATLLIGAVNRTHAVVWFDLDGMILDANDTFLSATGFTRDEVVGRHHGKLFDPAPAVQATYREFWDRLRQGEAQRGEFRHRRRDGSEIWLDASYVPLPGPDGRPVRVVRFAHDITLSKETAEDNAGKLAALSQSHAIVEFGLDGRIRTANANFLWAMGYRLEEVIGQSHRMFVDAATADSPEYAKFWRDLTAGRFARGSFRRIGKAGREVWFQASYSPIFDSDGHAVKIVKYASDITEAQRHSADSIGQVRAISKAQAVIEFALDGTVLTANHNFLEIFGYELSEIQGQHHRMFVTPEEVADPAYADFWQKLAAGEFQAAEYRRIGKDGREVWIQASYNPIFDPFGKPIKVVKFATDISDRRSDPSWPVAPGPARPRPAGKVVHASEAQFRTTIELAPVGMALLDEDCRILHVNAALCRFCGYTAEELLQMRLSELIPPNRRVISGAQRRLLRSGELRLLQMERRVICKDGSEAWALLHISQQTLAGSEAVEFIVQVQDITERRQMSQLKSNFVATVSHELRTPLTSIKGALGLVLGTMRAELPAKAERLLSIAAKNCDRLTMLVNDILDLEKISSGQSRFQPVDTPLVPLLEQAVTINQPYGQEFAVDFRLDLPDDQPWVRVDVERFQQVMSNLMSNAAKFSPRGSTVRIGCAAQADSLRITVTDRGPGVPEEFRERIFLPFTQADSSATREAGGTGLGLNITRQIVERLGGEIGFNNLATGGCEFWLVLPRTAPCAGEQNKVTALDCAGRLPAVLHVEADPDFAEIFRSAFGARARVVTAASRDAAIAALARQSFDVIVLDHDSAAPPEGAEAEGTMEEADLPESIALAAPGVPVYGLSAREGFTDGLLRASLIKSRVQLDEVVRRLLGGA